MFVIVEKSYCVIVVDAIWQMSESQVWINFIYVQGKRFQQSSRYDDFYFLSNGKWIRFLSSQGSCLLYILNSVHKLNKRLCENPQFRSWYFPILVNLGFYIAMSCLVPLQVSQLVESLTTLATIKYWRVAVHCLLPSWVNVLSQISQG